MHVNVKCHDSMVSSAITHVTNASARDLIETHDMAREHEDKD